MIAPLSTLAVTRAKRIVSDLVRSEAFSDFAAERRDDFATYPDRAARCHDAVSNGADGSTHQEAIQDMAAFWNHSLSNRRTRNPKTGQRREWPTRVDFAVGCHFDNLESWHQENGSLFSEIG